MRLEELKNQFEQLFGSVPRVFSAPGRINLIGEHTDYNDGFVMPAAIEFHTWVACARGKDAKVVVHSQEWGETVEFDLRESDLYSKHEWLDYIRGVAIQLQAAGFELSGSNLLIFSDVPMGAGLSSSAALEIASALALTSTAKKTVALDRVSLARLCQRAENETVGARVGIMDQFASASGRAGHALLLDCRSLKFELLPLPEHVSLVICNTMVPHRNVSGEYNLRRSQCELGVKYFAAKIPGVLALRDVSYKQFMQQGDELDQVIFRRCRHVITEIARTLKAADALKSRRIDCVGELMYESHKSLRDDYEVSCPELDILVDLASAVDGIYGARMMGGGFGGCTINLVNKNCVSEFTRRISEEYKNKTGISPQVYVTTAGDGAAEINV